jgi:hypothetical protein
MKHPRIPYGLIQKFLPFLVKRSQLAGIAMESFGIKWRPTPDIITQITSKSTAKTTIPISSRI